MERGYVEVKRMCHINCLDGEGVSVCFSQPIDGFDENMARLCVQVCRYWIEKRKETKALPAKSLTLMLVTLDR